MPKDFSGKNLRGRNFKGENLTGAKFIGADIRGANFTNAILREADFTRAKAGLQRHWTIFIVTISLFLSVISGLISGLTTVWVTLFFTLNNIKEYTLIPGILVLIVLAIFFIVTMRQGLVAGAATVAVAAAVAGAVTAAVAVVVAGAGATAVVVAGAGAGAAAVAGAVTVTVAVAVAGAAAGAGSIVGIYIAWRALAGDEKHAFVRKIAIAFTATGGTSFRNADLTDANFTEATLKSTDFRTANLTRTCFRKTEKLDRARVGNSILADTRVRELLITGNGYKKSYVGADLQGANLTGVNLNEANLKQANLNEATLHQANLEFANLTETQALATDFTAAYFTGAYLEAWNIDANTKLDRVDCRFVYLLEYPKPGTDDRERRPHHINKCFEPGDFEKLYKKIMTTVQILLKNGINPEAFTDAFQKLMQDFPDITPESIEGMDRKGNDVLLTIKVQEGTDKGKIEQTWDEVYQARLEAQRQTEQLKSKDEIIAIERHHYRVFQDFVKGVFSQYLVNPSTVPQPSGTTINLHAQSTAENKVASDNIDRSRKAKISGGRVNATGAGSLSLGDNDGTTANTIEELPDSATNPSQEDESISQSEDVESLRAIAEKYKAELKYKDREIDLYREKIEQLREINEILAKQPLSINIIQEDK
jgi:uncharacterized protein YjbI with pentapeptide repeats